MAGTKTMFEIFKILCLLVVTIFCIWTIFQTTFCIRGHCDGTQVFLVDPEFSQNEKENNK